MALEDKWVNKVDGVDDVSADDINTIADEVIQTQQNMPTKVSDLENDKGYLTEHQDISGKADITYVDDELAKKQDKELEWTLLDNITLTEDIQKYDLNLKSKGLVYGAKMIIEVPTDVAIGAGNIMAINENMAWIQDFITTAYNAGTYRSKIIVTTWIPQHGYYEATCTERSGVNLTAGKSLYNFNTSLFKAIRLFSVQFRGNLYTGTIIKVWGLVK